ncbi:MAG: sugar ABC transporter substrate-binding protein [Clostridiaceae bacterium]|nr:sugar ABC transporter substrate-binding protein [Clostridiaceae bacterium]
MRYIYIALIMVLIVLVAMLMNLYITFNTESNNPSSQSEPTYHFIIITRDNKDPFWARFKSGALEAGNQKNIFVEFVDISHKDPALSANAIERAILSEVDGIALQPYDVEISSDAVSKAMEAGIATLTFENDIYYIPNVPTVGSNSYEIGYRAGEMAAEASGGKAKIAIMVSEPGADKNKQYNNIKLQGLLDAISRYPKMTVEQIYALDTKMFVVDKLTMSLLADNPEIDLIICNDGENTPGVAQVVIDAGKVGIVNIIGFGNMPKTMDYIEEGVLYGTITADSYAIGYNTVMQLAEMCDGKQVNEVLNTNVYSFTADNIRYYREYFENNSQ